MGVSIITNEDKTEVRRYLLGQLGEADEERLELRLLTDPLFGEEFDVIVDEIAQQKSAQKALFHLNIRVFCAFCGRELES